jgi:membrane-associated phospholipid phosphatase
MVLRQTCRLDLPLHSTHRFRTPVLIASTMPSDRTTQFWTSVSLIGAPGTMTAVCLALIAALLLRGRWRGAIASLLIASGGGVLNVWLKNFFQRPRPSGAELLLRGHSWSFPSGHAMGAMIGYGLLGYCVVTYWPVPSRARPAIAVCVMSVILAIGVSRAELGVHYPGDVIGGWVIGALWLSAGVELLQRSETHSARNHAGTITRNAPGLMP